MFEALSPRLLVCALLTFLLSACDDGDSPCEPGEEIECSCDDGEPGTRYCLSNSRYDPCYCGSDLDFTPVSHTRTRDASQSSTSSPIDDLLDGVLDAGRLDAGRDTGVDVGPGDGVLLSASSERLVEMFAAGDDLLLVLPRRVSRVSLLDGGEQAHWDAPRALTAAAFDGTRLVALDSARLTVLELATLKEQTASNLVEPCSYAVLVQDGPLACLTGGNELLALEPADGGRTGAAVRPVRTGGRLLSVPGTRRLLVTDTSSGFYAPVVFEAPLDGGIALVGDASSALLSSGTFNQPFSFDGDPATNLITRQGFMFNVNATCGDAGDPCLVRSGTLGVLGTAETFVGMSHGEAGQLYGLIDPNPNASSFSGRCDTTLCRLVHVDVPARELRAELKIRRPLRDVVALRALPAHKALVVALSVHVRDPITSLSVDAGYQVVRFDLPEGK